MENVSETFFRKVMKLKCYKKTKKHLITSNTHEVNAFEF